MPTAQAPTPAEVQASGRRVRHDVADAARLAAFSLAVSAAVALGLSALSNWAGAA